MSSHRLISHFQSRIELETKYTAKVLMLTVMSEGPIKCEFRLCAGGGVV